MRRFLLLALLLGVPAAARAEEDDDASAIDDSTWVDHDGRPIPAPPEWEPSFWGHQLRDGFIEPVSHIFDVPDKLIGIADFLGADPEHEAVNVNAFDEVPNSSWFTNRNHVRAVPLDFFANAATAEPRPQLPWVIKKLKSSGQTAGFQIKDAAGKRWLIKIDPEGYPQIASGADLIAVTLLQAAGYNLPHNQPVRFRRSDLTIDEELREGKEGVPFDDEDLEDMLARGSKLADGSYSALASLFVEGEVLGAPSMRRRRPGDGNDWYTHKNRRELRGLYVVCSWLNSWDTKDHNFLDTFVETRDSLGHVQHYIIDAGASLGVGAKGPKKAWNGYEHTVDFGWIGRRLLTLGFIVEPWRRADQETGIPSVGRLESDVYDPGDFKTLMPQPAFREMTERDGYWGAKIVASFSDAQIRAVVESAGYEDSRATDFLVRALIARRDKTVRYWFARVAPLDFFYVEDGVLRFHDLAVDTRLEGPREYDAEVDPEDGTEEHIQIQGTALPLEKIGNGASRLAVELSIVGHHAKPARVELERRGSTWVVTEVRHS